MIRRSQRDFEDEIKSHLELEADRLKAQGLSNTDAHYAALRHFGNVGVAEDRYFHANRFASMDEFMRDLRHALRGLTRTPGFLATAVITLALAIGAVAGMFGVVNTVMLRPLPFPNPDRLVVLGGMAPGTDLRDTVGLGNEFYIHIKENSKLIDGIFTYGGGTSTLRVDDRVERIEMGWPSNDMYATLGVQPQLGRLPNREDRDDVFVISDRLWTTWFNRDTAVLGKWYFVSDSMKQVVGIMPPEFKFLSDSTNLWVSGEVNTTQVTPGSFGNWTAVRMKPGVTEEQLKAELKVLTSQLPARFGAPPAYANIISKFQPIVVPLRDERIGTVVKTSLLILLGAVAVVLLVACANVANLFLVRAETRRRDFTVRRAVGASRAQLIRFQMAESFVVALISGVCAVVLAAVTLPAFLRAAPAGIPRLGQVRVDLPTLGAAFLLVIVVAMVCGIIPAIRSSAPDLTGLRAGSRGNIGGGRQWGRDVLVVAQTALALVLLIGSALLVQSFNRLRNVDPGYNVENVYTFQFAPDQPGLRDGPSLGRMHLAMMDKIRALPGTQMVGVVNNLPLDEGTGGVRVLPEGVMTPDNAGILLTRNFVGGDYFKAAGIRILRGRAFTDAEAISPNNSVIISASAAEKMWPGQEALGRTIRPRMGGQDTLAFTVVGVVNDVKQLNWRDQGDAILYHALTGPAPQFWGLGSPAYVVKSSRAELLKPEIRRLVKEIAPEAPVYREFTMEFLTRRMMLQLSFTTLTLGVLSVLALVLGAVGLYGTLSYVVAQRTREIGVRMALGATASAVRGQVVAQGVRVVLVGAVIGVVAAYLTTKFLSTLLYEVTAVDPLAFAGMSAMMIAMGVLASYVPARRASNVAPMEALRSD